MQKKFSVLRRYTLSLVLTLAITAMMVTPMVTPAFAQGVSFKGKMVRIIINLGSASALSANYQAFAPFVARYLPGKPKIIVEAKPGGRGALGTSYMFKNVKPNGETMATLLFLTGALITGDKLPVDISKFVYVGSTGQTSIEYARTDSGLKSADDLANPPKQLIMGNASPNAGMALSVKLFLNALGLKGKYKALHGYRGMLGMLQSVRSGETNMSYLHAGQWFARLPGFKKEGKIFGLFEFGILGKDGKTHGSSESGLPTLEATWEKLLPNSLDSKEYKAYHNVLRIEKPISWLHVLPPGTPDKYRKVWDHAMASAFKDPEYLALLAKRGAPPAVFTGSEKTAQLTNQIIKNMKDPDVKAAIASVFTKK